MNINEFTDEDLIQDEIVLDGNIPENIPPEEVPIEVEGPEGLLDPKVQVYVPKATTYRWGIAKYDSKDFLVDPDGKVSLIVDLDDVKNKTDDALENSQTALETSSEAKSIAEDALEQVIIGEGTKIYENGVLQSSINVDSDIQGQLDDIKEDVQDIQDIQEDVQDIQEVIPAQASSENQLADKEFVNSSIATNTANFIGTFVDVPTLLAYSGTITNNDYAFVVNSERDFTSTTEMNAYNKNLLTNFDYAWIPNGSNYDLYRFDILEQTWVLKVTDTAKADVTLNTAYNRYKAVVVGNTVSWGFEYTLNNSSFTADQWAAINSGITASGVTQISDLQTNKADKNNATQEIVAKKMTATVYKVSTAGNAVIDGTEWGLDAFNGSLRLISNRSNTDIEIDVPQNRSVKFYNGSMKVAEIDKDGIAGLVPIGSIVEFASSNVPSNYLLCNGQAVSRIDYAELFAVIGTTWGVGNGSTTFNVPNFQGRVAVGAGVSPESSATTYSFGLSGGSKNAVVVAHEHAFRNNATGRRVGVGYGNPGFDRINNVTFNTDIGEEIVTRTAGESGTDKNMMPYLVMYYIIRAK